MHKNRQDLFIYNLIWFLKLFTLYKQKGLNCSTWNNFTYWSAINCVPIILIISYGIEQAVWECKIYSSNEVNLRLSNNTLSVIPAKAGIQYLSQFLELWIPDRVGNDSS